MKDFPKTQRSRVRRLPKRGKYDRRTIYQILDRGFVCHVGFVADAGQPFVIPTLYARTGDAVLIHGSALSRMLKNLSRGIDVCLNVTLVDGLVLARSAFNHSMNYRSAVVFGRGKPVADRAAKLAALRRISENVLAGRFADSRPPTAKELDLTTVIRIDIEEASAKIRAGDPVDDRRDYDAGFWAGVLPFESGFGEPEPAADLGSGIKLPDYLQKFRTG